MESNECIMKPISEADHSMSVASKCKSVHGTVCTERFGPQHVAMLCNGDEVYGVGTVLKLYAQGAPGLRFVCLGEGPMLDWLRQHGHEVQLVKGLANFRASGSLATLMRLPTALARGWRHAGRIDEQLGRHGVQIIHTHWLPQQMIAGFMRRLDYRVVWHIHNNMNPRRLFGWGVRLNHQLARWGADLILPVSDFIAANYCGCGVTVNTVHNAAARVYDSPNQLPASPVWCLIAGRLTEGKGQHLAVQAVIAARRAGLDVRLDIYGGSTEGNKYADQLQEIIQHAGAQEAIRFMGFCSDLRQRHQNYHLGLQCRIDPEPCSMWVCETLMDGVPLLASATGGTPELVEDGVTGLLFRGNDLRDLTDKLIELTGDLNRMNAMRKAAFLRGREHLTVERFIRQTFEAYTSLSPHPQSDKFDPKSL